MTKLPLIARILLGLVYTASGIAGLLQLGEPPELEGATAKFMEGMMATGYFFPLLKITETVCGLLLISGFAVPLALVVLAPITLQILAYHAFLDPTTLPVAIVMTALHLYLGRAYKSAFAGVLELRASPG